MAAHTFLPLALGSVALASLAAVPAASASSSQWYAAEGGRVRLVTTGQADDKGVLQGALEIDLEPGWKTYWRDPGGAGVPPTLDPTASRNVASAELSFPAPHRFDDGFSIWAGYKEPVSFPVAFRLTDAGQPATIDAKVFLGICETICIPVQATFAVDPASDPDNPGDAAAVQAALGALPGPEQPDFGVTLVKSGKDEVLVQAEFAGDPGMVDFFLAGSDGYQFGPPQRREQGEKLLFSAPILERPEKTPAGGALHYTLVTEAGAVAGTLPYPPAP